MLRSFFVPLAIVLLLPMAASAMTLDIVGGVLIGASDVEVRPGAFYDVTFETGSCESVFDGCDESSDILPEGLKAGDGIDFSIDATQALMDDVFVGTYDLYPRLTAGCETTPTGSCYVWTPSAVGFYPGEVEIAHFRNSNRESEDSTLIAGNIYTDTEFSDSGYPGNVFARWTLVPEPSTPLLLGVGCVLIARWRRHFRR